MRNFGQRSKPISKKQGILDKEMLKWNYYNKNSLLTTKTKAYYLKILMIKFVKNNIYKYSLSALLTIGMLTLVYDSIVFGHFHQISNKHYIYHFHPYAADSNPLDPIKTHSHTPEELLLILMYNTSLVSLAIVIGALLIHLYQRKLKLIALPVNKIKKQKLLEIPTLRAPPIYA